MKKLPPKREKIVAISILKQLSDSANTFGEYKGIAKTIPNHLNLYNIFSAIQKTENIFCFFS